MPPSERQTRSPARKRPAAAPAKQALIEKERNRLFDEVMMLREARGASGNALETARLLLTKQWIKANWRTREQLIKAAEWMLRVESQRDAQSPA